MIKKGKIILALYIIITCIAFVLVGQIVFFTFNNAPIDQINTVDMRLHIPVPFAVFTRSSITPKEITHGDTSKKDVIFTFDGGGGIQSGDKILEVLAKHHVKGTFFLTGKMVATNPDLVKRIAAAGNEIFSHTYDHPNLTMISNDQIGSELAKFENILQATVGISPKPYFRAPYGARNSRVLAVAAKYGYQSVYWTVDARDWMKSPQENPAKVKERILSSVAPGNIYLMHVGDTITGQILDSVFTAIEARGYKIVSLTQGL